MFTSLGLILGNTVWVYAGIVSTVLFILAIWMELAVEELDEDDSKTIVKPVVIRGSKMSRAS